MSESDTKRLSTEELDRLRQADVSPELLTVARQDPEAVGKKRNSAREQMRKMLRAREDTTPPEDLPVRNYGGDYLEALREGSLAGAFIRADIANIRILLDTFGRDYLIERLIEEEGWTSERAERYTDERIEEFAADLSV